MSVIRVQKNKNYTVMSNVHLRDKRLSLKAKGLLSMILALPDDWTYSINGLVSICKENGTAVKTALSELKECGYLRVTKLNPNETKSGRFEYVYDVFEEPQEKESQAEEKQDTENLYLENIALYKDTEKSNTKVLNTDRLNTDYQRIIDLYHEHCPSLPKIVKLTDVRKRAIRTRLKTYTEDDLITAFDKAEASDFLRKGSGTWNGASFDWIMNPRNLVKILEGNYDNRPQTGKEQELDSFYDMANDWAKKN